MYHKIQKVFYASVFDGTIKYKKYFMLAFGTTRSHKN